MGKFCFQEEPTWLRKKDAAAKMSEPATKRSEIARSGQNNTWYATRLRDRLRSVAGRFRMSVDTLAVTNGLAPNQGLAPVKILTICTQKPGALRPEKRKVD
jgi:hypothetical protein